MYRYYRDQLEKLKTDKGVSIKLIGHDKGETNWMALNEESIYELRMWLLDVERSLHEIRKRELRQQEILRSRRLNLGPIHDA